MKSRILHISHSAGSSGAEQALLRMISGIDRELFELLVALPGDGPLRVALEKIGVRTFEIPVRWWIPATHWTAAEFVGQAVGLQQRWPAVALLAKEERVDLIHTNTLVTVEGALAAAALGIPHVWHSRGLFSLRSLHPFPPGYFDDYDFLFSVIDELGDRVVCVSNAVYHQAVRYLRTTPCTVIPDGFDAMPTATSTRREFFAELGMRDDARAIACIGGVQRRKGQLDLIEAFVKVSAEHPDAVLLLCGETGDDEYVTQVRKRISNLRLESRIRLLGFRTDVANIIHHSEMVVQPSHSEGFGLAVVEAMAAGKAVVATRCGGPEEVIQDGISGLLTRASDPAALTEAISSLLANAGRVQEMGAAARRRVSGFTAGKCSRAFEDLLTQVLSLPSGKSPEAGRADGMCAQLLTRFEAAVSKASVITF